MTLRFTSSNLAGTLRKLVAVGTVRLRSMFAAIAAPAPRMGLPGSSSVADAVAVVLAAATGAGAGVGAGVEPFPSAAAGIPDGPRYDSTTACTCVDTAAAAATLGACDW